MILGRKDLLRFEPQIRKGREQPVKKLPVSLGPADRFRCNFRLSHERVVYESSGPQK